MHKYLCICSKLIELSTAIFNLTYFELCIDVKSLLSIKNIKMLLATHFFNKKHHYETTTFMLENLQWSTLQLQR